VEKAKVVANGEYNFSGERYREGRVGKAAWPMVHLGELTRRLSGGTPSKDNRAYWSGSIPWVSPKDMKENLLRDTEDHISEAAVQGSAVSLVPAGTLLCVVRSGILKHTLPLAITAREMCFNQDISALIPNDRRLDVHFLFWMLKARSREILEKGIKPGVTVQSFHTGFFDHLELPLPPLDLQKEIVAEIEGYQKVIDGARTVIENYRPHIPIHPDWPVVELKAVCEVITDDDHQPPPKSNNGIPFVTISNIDTQGRIDFSKTFFVHKDYYESLKPSRRPQRGDILYTVTGSYGVPVYVDSDRRFCFQRHIGLIRPTPAISTHYLYTLLASTFVKSQADRAATGVAQKTVSLNALRSFAIPLPPLATQQALVAEIEAEQALVAANHELIERFEKKIQATLARVWGEES
jgi:type I restriction enzyme M protein